MGKLWFGDLHVHPPTTADDVSAIDALDPPLSALVPCVNAKHPDALNLSFSFDASGTRPDLQRLLALLVSRGKTVYGCFGVLAGYGGGERWLVIGDRVHYDYFPEGDGWPYYVTPWLKGEGCGKEVRDHPGYEDFFPRALAQTFAIVSGLAAGAPSEGLADALEALARTIPDQRGAEALIDALYWIAVDDYELGSVPASPSWRFVEGLMGYQVLVACHAFRPEWWPEDHPQQREPRRPRKGGHAFDYWMDNLYEDLSRLSREDADAIYKMTHQLWLLAGCVQGRVGHLRGSGAALNLYFSCGRSLPDEPDARQEALALLPELVEPSVRFFRTYLDGYEGYEDYSEGWFAFVDDWGGNMSPKIVAEHLPTLCDALTLELAPLGETPRAKRLYDVVCWIIYVCEGEHAEAYEAALAARPEIGALAARGAEQC